MQKVQKRRVAGCFCDASFSLHMSPQGKWHMLLLGNFPHLTLSLFGYFHQFPRIWELTVCCETLILSVVNQSHVLFFVFIKTWPSKKNPPEFSGLGYDISKRNHGLFRKTEVLGQCTTLKSGQCLVAFQHCEERVPLLKVYLIISHLS